MSLNSTPRANRYHIAFLGRTNAGKSSLINAVSNQNIALVSPVKGTTTDPVYRPMELLPVGPVVMIDTAGLDDVSELGELRREKTLDILNKADLAVLVIDAMVGYTSYDQSIAVLLKEKNIPIVAAWNKIDCNDNGQVNELPEEVGFPVIPVSAQTGQGIEALKKNMMENLPNEADKFRLVGDLINPGDFVVLVVPIDKAAPKGRLILPQQQTVRDILETDAIAVVTKEYELRETLANLGRKPKMVITDSQVFLKVSADTPKDIMMTSFSILFARYKGDLVELVKGASAIENLKDQDRILISEGCTHHRQSDDIGTVKIPRWLRQRTGKQLIFDHVSGIEYPKNLGEYALVVHCGACMLNRKEVMHRIEQAKKVGVPIVNYGVLIAWVHGILDRALIPFPRARMEWAAERTE